MVDLTADSAVRVLGTAQPVDALLSANGETLYRANANGSVGVYNVDTGNLTVTWSVGNRLQGLSLSVDGRYLSAVEAAPVYSIYDQYGNVTKAVRAYRIDTQTSAIDRYDVMTNSYSGGAFFDTAYLANGTILLSQRYDGSGWITMKTLDPTTATFTNVSGFFRQDSVLSLNGDQTRVLVAEANISNAPLTVLQFSPTGSSTVVGSTTGSGFNSGVQAFSESGNLIANLGGGGILIFNGSLQYQRNLRNDFPAWDFGYIAGLAFDASGSNLYVLDITNKVIIKISTSTWQEVGRIGFGPDVGQDSPGSGRFGNNLQLSDDGDYLIVVHNDGVLRVDVRGINGTAENDTIVGSIGEDHIYGLAGNDILDGKGGNDLLVGGTGDDRYYVYSLGDTLIEKAGEGIDEIRTAISIYTLADNFENLTLVDPGDHAAAIGNAADNVIRGNIGRDHIYGRAGNDTLYDGGGAADTLIGGTGNDIYYVENRFSSTVEAAGEGTDEVRTSSAIYALQANVENLTAIDNGVHGALVGNALDNVIIGGTGTDDLFGRAGNDTLKGGTGAANTLFGQEGDDIYYVDAVGDSVKEFAGEGVDQVFTTLASFVLPENVEQLAYIGSGAFVGIGNNQSNVLRGGAQADILSGFDGDDVIIGGSGADELQGGAGPDQFRYLGGEIGVDRILDFTAGSDKIVLMGSGFAHTSTFAFLSTALDPQPLLNGNSTFLYNSNSGMLSYDPDGNGEEAAIQLAQLNAGLSLSANDFLILS